MDTGEPKSDERAVGTSRSKSWIRTNLAISCYSNLERTCVRNAIARLHKLQIRMAAKIRHMLSNLLFCARLYTFAEEKLVESLVVSCFHNIYNELPGFKAGTNQDKDKYSNKRTVRSQSVYSLAEERAHRCRYGLRHWNGISG